MSYAHSPDASTVNIMANLFVDETVEHGNGETLETKEELSRV